MIASAEESVALMVGKAFTASTGSVPVTAISGDVATFEFEAEFQTKVATLYLRNADFVRKVGHLIEPQYFENIGEASIVSLAQRHWKKYNQLPDKTVAIQLLKEDLDANIIRKDVKTVAVEAFRAIFSATADLTNSDFVAERVAKFAQYQAISKTILDSVDLIGKGQFEKIAKAVKEACEVGLNQDSEEYDYFARIAERTAERQDRLLGIAPNSGITTGQLEMDKRLYHKGWGKKELSVIMGGAKSGKSTALINFSKCASLAGKNVLYVTLEVSAEIISERLDASMSDTLMKELVTKMHDVKSKIEAIAARSGALKVHEFASGTLTPDGLRQLIQKYKSPKITQDGSVRPAIIFDIVALDYADIMAPNIRNQDVIENSKNVWLDLRAIAFEENIAMLTATQTNREGFKSTVAKAEHIADDFNKVRTADLIISINATDEEKANGEARLFFAASRNQEGGFTIFIKQELAKMRFITGIVRIE